MREQGRGSAAPGRRDVDEQELLRMIRRSLSGDERSMEALYMRFRGAVYGCARNVVRDEHEAEDITQQVFLKLLTSLDSFRPSRGSFEGWLLRVARNAALDHLRARRMVSAAELHGVGDPAPQGMPVLRALLRDALAELPTRQRRVLILMYLGFSPPEVAREMGISPGAVHVLHHRARRRVVVRLREQGVRPAVVDVRRHPEPAYPLRGSEVAVVGACGARAGAARGALVEQRERERAAA